jgi:hypothetical protein
MNDSLYRIFRLGDGVLPRTGSDSERLALDFPELDRDLVRSVREQTQSYAEAHARLADISRDMRRQQQQQQQQQQRGDVERFVAAERSRQELARAALRHDEVFALLAAANAKNVSARRTVGADLPRSKPVRIPIADAHPSLPPLVAASPVAAPVGALSATRSLSPTPDNDNDPTDDSDADSGDDDNDDHSSHHHHHHHQRHRRRAHHSAADATPTTHKRAALSSSPPALEYGQPKGLANDVGDNNCFLNVIIQCLFHLPPFRSALAEASSRKHRCLQDCLLCGLQSIFSQFAFGDSPQPLHRQIEHAVRRPSLSAMIGLPRALVEQFTGASVQENTVAAVPPTALRQALAALYAPQGRFQLHRTDDATEAFDAILNELHTSISEEPLEPQTERADGVNCCVAHATFGMVIRERSECSKCRAPGPATPKFSQFVHYVSAAALREAMGNVPDMTFEDVVRQLACTTTQRCEKCDLQAFVEPELLTAPKVLTLGFVWDSNSCSSEDIGATLRCVATSINTATTFGAATACRYELRATLAYYGMHYVAFAFNPATQLWHMFDDARVRRLGANFASVVPVIEKARLQPVLLFFEAVDEASSKISAANARQTRS